MKSNKKILIIVGVVLLVILGGVAGVFVFKKDDKKAEPEAEQEYVEEAKSEYDKAKESNVKDSDDPSNVEINFDGLKQINQDIIAWIKIPGTNVDYPILQNTEEDDSYYLNRTMEGQEGLPGSIYMEKYDSPDFTDTVSVIYGHTLHDGTMFSELKKYQESDFLGENPYIYIYLPDGTVKKFQIFAAVAFDDRYLIKSYAFDYDKDFDKFISDLKACEVGNIDEAVNVAFGSPVITLSTCIDEYPEQRWLVNAVLVNE